MEASRFSSHSKLHEAFAASSQFQPSTQTSWSWEENKAFENAIAEIGNLECPNLLQLIAARLPRKRDLAEIKAHLDALIQDVNLIESDQLVHSPDSWKSSESEGGSYGKSNTNSQPKKKPIPWTPEEHERFLVGLEKYGKGDWRSISRHWVITKTPTQVASHAQKYFKRRRRNTESKEAVDDSNNKDGVDVTDVDST